MDDNTEFLTSAAEVMAQLGGSAWQVLTAPSGGEAMAFLQKHPVDLVLIDVNMPVLDGVQLLGLLQRRFPSVVKVVLTGEASSEQRAACLTAGAELVLEKPTAETGWTGIHAALETLLHAPKEEGFQGVLRKVSLPDVIQMECLSINSSVLEVTGAGLRGRLYIKDGQIVHSEIGELSGVDALNNLLCLPGGSFQLLPFTDPGRETISGQWEFLLMEAARVRDETQAALADGQSAVDPEPLPEVAAIEAFSVQPPKEGDTKFASASAPVSLTPADRPQAAETTTGMQPVVKETLICSLQGDVLYEWNCAAPLERVALLEFITRRAANMAADLPLGGFERFEAAEKGARCVAKLDGDRGLFVRVQAVLAAGPGGSGTP